MDRASDRSLRKEASESFLLLAIVGLTLAGYVGIAFVFLGALHR